METKIQKPTDSLDAYVASFEAGEQTAAAPAWLKAIRRTGISHFTELGFPTLKQEDWRFCNVAPIAKLAFKPVLNYSAQGVKASDVESFAFPGMTGDRLVFIDGQFSKELSNVQAHTGGVKVCNLAQALVDDEKNVETHLSRFARVDESGFSALNTAFIRDGAYVFVPTGKVIDQPVHVLFIATTGQPGLTIQPRNLIIAQARAQVKVVESYVTLGTGVHFTNAVTEVIVGEEANVEHCKFQEESTDAYHVATVQAQLATRSHYTSHSISTGARIARNNINLVMAGEHVDCVMNGLYLVGGKQLVDHHTIADHAKPNCGSHEFYHGIMGGQSRGVFNGKIFVRKDAQKTDAKQTNRNLLLSNDAVIDTKPQLEIFADDVKCTHGATVGQLNDDAIFYFRSRAIGEETARQMLTHAFATEIVNRIKVPAVRDHLDSLLWNRLEQFIEK